MLRRRRLILLVTLFAGVVGSGLVLAQNSTVTIPFLHQNVYQWGGATVPAAVTLSDAVSNPIAPLVASHHLLWDTTQWMRGKATALLTFPTAATLTSRSITGAQLVEKSSRWFALSNPAVSNQATASIAAEASVRHVADCISFAAVSTTAPSLTALTINLRDGATGAGTLIWTQQLVIAAATGQNVEPQTICGLNLTGATNTAMTLEFSALVTNVIQSVSMTGFNVQ